MSPLQHFEVLEQLQQGSEYFGRPPGKRAAEGFGRLVADVSGVFVAVATSTTTAWSLRLEPRALRLERPRREREREQRGLVLEPLLSARKMLVLLSETASLRSLLLRSVLRRSFPKFTP